MKIDVTIKIQAADDEELERIKTALQALKDSESLRTDIIAET